MSEPGDRPEQGGGYPPPYGYPQWQPPVPPKKTSPAAIVLITGSVVVVIVMALAFLAWGYPGFLREPDANAGGGWFTDVTLADVGRLPDDHGERPGVDRRAAGPRCRPGRGRSPTRSPARSPRRPGHPRRSRPLRRRTARRRRRAPSNVRLETSAGAIGLTLDRALAPCTVVNFLSLAKQGFYNGTSCHRLSVTTGLQMLQCGDPVGDGTGGPGYTIKDETFPELKYGRGVLAMAKTAEPDTGGSQFFLVFGDTQIPPEYSVFGRIDDAGLEVLDKVAQGGIDTSKPGIGDGSGPPKIPVTFTQVTTP